MSESETPQTYQVLARKYRPHTFEDMIGQESMVTTLTNAFKAGRIAHAFMLTGVRGIGKTTTARLLARALNYETDKITDPSVELGKPGIHCESIMASSHMDVLEMDAASRTGVENMRELLDGVRYAPVSARYKVYIIDEVHMLSTGAFNALLKTLEEPPDHAKFIFATTEIRKVPVTVLSRCQRFDLRRVEAGSLKTHLEGICKQENVKVDDDGLVMIARAAEGSVRDALSLLDQAIVQGGLDGSAVTGEEVRAMLGLADRGRIVDLFASASGGNAAAALTEMRAQYDDGADPVVVMRDLLDVCHEVSRAKTLGEAAEFDAAPDQAIRLKEISEGLSAGQVSRIWQMLLKAYGEVRSAPVPLAAAEMALLRIAVAGELPPPELAAEILKDIKSGNFKPPVASASSKTSSGISSAKTSNTVPPSTPTSIQGGSSPSALSVPKAAPTPIPTAQIESLTDFVENLGDTQIQLKYDVEKYVELIRFRPGAITIAKLDSAPVTLIGRMVEALRDMTGNLWLIEQEDGEGAPSISEARKRAVADQAARDRSHPAFSHSLLKNAKLLEIRDVPTTSESNVINADFSGQSEPIDSEEQD
ncbi:MAG: DNA polymerase III subunit gamma/tau [Hellea sp.]|nr:DNA polymerase III subunit gamma/tau [Hellea sp.]